MDYFFYLLIILIYGLSVSTGTLAQNSNWETKHSVDEFTDENTSTLIGYSEDKSKLADDLEDEAYKISNDETKNKIKEKKNSFKLK